MENEINTWFNDGRWLTACPVCGSNTQIKPIGSKSIQKVKWYCGRCHPGKIKRVLKKGVDNSLSYGYSGLLQRRAANAAFSIDEIHIAIFPKDWLEAERLLKMRFIEHQHYRPHEIYKRTGKPETARDLAQENESDSLLFYVKKSKIEASTVSKNNIEVEELEVEIKTIPSEIYKDLQ